VVGAGLFTTGVTFAVELGFIEAEVIFALVGGILIERSHCSFEGGRGLPGKDVGGGGTNTKKKAHTKSGEWRCDGAGASRMREPRGQVLLYLRLSVTASSSSDSWALNLTAFYFFFPFFLFQTVNG